MRKILFTFFLILIVLIFSFNTNAHSKINIAIWERVIDIYKGLTPGDTMIISNVCSGLLKATDIENVKPDIAYYWTVNRDRTEYTFKIRKDVYFHSGKKLTAWDIKRFFEIIIKENINPFFKEQLIFKGSEPYIKGKRKDISGITVKDDYTITFKLRKKEPMFFYYIGSPPSYIRFKRNDHLDCAGPYKIKGIIKNSSVEKIFLEKERNFYRKDEGSPRFVSISIERVGEEEIKNFDIVEISPGIIFRNKTKLLNTYNLVQIPTLSTSYIIFGDGFWAKNINFRKFMFNLVDVKSLFLKEKFVSCIYAKNILPYRFTFFKESPSITQNFSHGIEALRKIPLSLKAKNPVKIIATNYLERIERAKILKNFLEKHGFIVKITVLPHREYVGKINSLKREWDIAFIRLSPDTPDLYDFLLTYFKGDSETYYPIVRDRDLNFLIDFFATDTSYQGQLSTINLIIKLIERKALLIPLFYHINFYLVKKNISSVYISPLFGLDLTKLKIREPNEKNK